MTSKAQYAHLFSRGGRRVTIERRVANADPIRAENVRVRIRDFSPEEIASGIHSGSRKILVLAADVPASLTPLRSADAVLVDGLRLTFTERPDDQTHRDGDVLLAYECIASGA